MRTIELYRWRLTSPITGRRYTSGYLMTEADARELDPTAERVAGTQEDRQVPDDPLESTSTGGPMRSLPLRRP